MGTVIQGFAKDNKPFEIIDMTVEYTENPIGIDADNIRFGWKMQSNLIGNRQIAYEINVFDGNESVWNSGKVESNISVGIKYGGKALKDGQRYLWNVTVYDERGNAITSEDAFFEIGVTNTDEWKNAQFISMNSSPSAPIFRTERKLLDKELCAARLYITAMGVYKAYVNGSEVSCLENGEKVYHHMNPGYGNGNVSLGYQTYDITNLIDNDVVAVSAVCGTGWYNGMWATNSSPALKALVVLTFADGEKQYISTNTTDWKGTLQGAITSNGVYYGEDYDARKNVALGDFTQVGYDDSKWVNSLTETKHEDVVIKSEFNTVEANALRVKVLEIGPAVKEDNENRLQIMEIEAFDNNGDNVIQSENVIVSETLNANEQWKSANLTDGDNGVTSDCGYTTEILDYGKSTLTLSKPITFDFYFEEKTSINEIKIYPRVNKDSISGELCANYPKSFEIQYSCDNGKTWETVKSVNTGNVKNTYLYGTEQMTTKEYPGEIRARMGTVGKVLTEYSKEPVSATIYTGAKAESTYIGGEINVDKVITSNGNDNLFNGGVTLKKGSTMIVNFGQNMSAIPEIEFSANNGTVLTMRFAEMLNDGSKVGTENTDADGPKGSIYQKSLRNARSEVIYTFAGNGKEYYKTLTSFFGYQYVEITATDDVTIHFMKSNAVSSVSEQTGNIETNNENVNKLFSNVLYGQLSNYFTTSTDCNQRDERSFWSGDTQAFAQTGLYNFNSFAFFEDLQEIMNENTMIKGYSPAIADDLNGYFSNWAAGWSDVLVIVPWTIYLQTGDKTVLENSYEAMTKYMDYLEDNERGRHQAPLSNINFGDWLSFQGTSVEVISDYYYGYVTEIMKKTATVLGDDDGINRYSKKFDKIKDKFLSTHVTFLNKKLVIKSGKGDTSKQFHYDTGKGGVWEDNSQTALLWMLKLKFYKNDDMRDAAIRLLVENIKNENPDSESIRAQYGKNTLAVGFLGSNVLLPVLSIVGESDVAFDLLLQDENPSWLFEVKAGATTIWERWNSYTPNDGFGDSEMNSFNHYAYGSVAEWMYRYMVGIDHTEDCAGFKKVILQPSFDCDNTYNDEVRIDNVNGSYNSQYGIIDVNWNSNGGKMQSYNVVLPANTSGELYLPIGEEFVKNFANIDGVEFKGMTSHNGKECAKFILASGGYSFTVTDNDITVQYMVGYTADSFVPENTPDETPIKESLWTKISNWFKNIWEWFKNLFSYISLKNKLVVNNQL